MDHFSVSQQFTSGIITLLIVSLFIFFAAKFVLGRTSIIAAIATAFLGTLAAGLVLALVDTIWLARVLAIATWALIAAVFFRAKWVQGAIIGLVAWVLWLIVNYVVARWF